MITYEFSCNRIPFKLLKYKICINLVVPFTRKLLQTTQRFLKFTYHIFLHYKKSQLFKRFNLIKMSTLIKRMFIFIKSMRHERHMVFLADSFDWNDHFDQMLNRTSTQEGQIFKMVHWDAHGLIKLAILNGHAQPN